MELLVRYWYIIVGGAVWILLFLNRHRIESPWVRAALGLSLEDHLFKAAMQGRKDFTTREIWGWVFVILLMISAPLVTKLLS